MVFFYINLDLFLFFYLFFRVVCCRSVVEQRVLFQLVTTGNYFVER